MKAEVARLVEQAQFEGLQLTGEGGLLPDMIKQAVEAALQGEMSAHLGYERYAAEGRGSGNSRNGSTAKTVQTAAGPAEVSVPRDRAGTFDPVTVPKGARRFTEFDDMVIALYAKGLTTRDIAEWLQQTYGAKISHETVANITDSVNELVKAWRSRPLDEVYPIVYIDAIRVRVRDGGAVRIKACHLAVGVDLEGRKRVLGMWIEQNEGARFWLGVLTELRNRGIRDVLIVCCDGLIGLPEVVGQIWPQALVQTSSVHHGDGGRVPPVTRAVLVRTCADVLPSRSRCRPVRLGRWRALNLPAGAAPVERRDEVPTRPATRGWRGPLKEASWSQTRVNQIKVGMKTHGSSRAWTGAGRSTSCVC
jgi:putative transposase